MKKIIPYIIILLLLIIPIILFINIKNKDNDNKEKNNTKDNLTYEIINDRNLLNNFTISNQKRGHEIKKIDNNYYLLIYYGMQSTYYSFLDVESINTKDNKLNIVVKLPSNEGMGDAFSYPFVIIKLNNKPKDIKIIYK